MNENERPYALYNALYCNGSYTRLSRRVGEHPYPGYQVWDVMNYATDAALECCGHTGYKGSVKVAVTICRAAGGDRLVKDLLIYLQAYATAEHLASLMDGDM